MGVQAYQFIKYDQNTTIHHLERVCKTGAIVCFDFEDGIEDPIHRSASTSLKIEYRAHFLKIHSTLTDYCSNVKIGIRLNGYNTSDFERDIVNVEGMNFDSIFLPKIEIPEEIENIVRRLYECRITYNHLIPVIESKIGLDNLEQIIQSNPVIDKLSFGHCDYNLNNHIFPFFHHDSREYWKWIDLFFTKIDNCAITFINSPCLYTNDDHFFCCMLEYLTSKKQGNMGQITLTTHQSELCNGIQNTSGVFLNLLLNKNKIAVDRQIAKELVEAFEECNKSKGLSRNKERFISFQEYIAAKNMLTDPRPAIETCFVGGCFPVQHNIVYENLYHQKLRNKLERENNIRLNVNIVRYERFNTLIDKIDHLVNMKAIDILVFHIRPEPYLRLAKFAYKYIDEKGKLKWSFNLPYFNLINPEKYDLLRFEGMVNPTTRNRSSRFHKLLITCNYLIGKMVGNQKYALRSYLNVTHKVIGFCAEKNIQLIIQGPNIRNHSLLEPSLCKDLNTYISRKTSNMHSMVGLEMVNEMYNPMTQKNGIHVTQEYHDLVADKLFDIIQQQKCYSRKGVYEV